MIWYCLLQMSQVWAEGGHSEAAASHADPHAIPWHSIFVQSFNLFLLLGLLFMLLRKTVVAHFEHRARDYQQMVERAEAARAEAEHGKKTIKDRLAKLEASADQGVHQAKAEAEELKGRILREAKALAEKYQQDAERTGHLELEKAKAELRRMLLTQSLADCKDMLKKNLGSSDQKKLQNEFAEKIQVVGG